uniref:Glycerate kinase n=2 Tax=Podarcis muralis TaxID=64176 RepID=A0A670ILT2_PODMU
MSLLQTTVRATILVARWVFNGRPSMCQQRTCSSYVNLYRAMLLKPRSRIQVMEGAKHNLPDRAALKAANAIRDLAEGLTAGDLLLVLISGGGSALLPAPIPPVTLEEKETITRLLASKGATIHELNTIRKALSLLKGGGLVLSLILSDVIGDPLDIIASGPTVASSHGAQDCFHILTRYNMLDTLPQSVQTVLSGSATGHNTPKDYSHVFNVVIGSNRLALEEARGQAEELGYLTLVLSDTVCGEVGTVARLYSLHHGRVCCCFSSATGALMERPEKGAFWDWGWERLWSCPPIPLTHSQNRRKKYTSSVVLPLGTLPTPKKTD